MIGGRHVMPICSDGGAAPPWWILRLGRYRRLLHVPGTGHEVMNTLRVVLRLLYHLGGGVLATALNWDNPAQQRYIFEGADNHKADAFLMLQIFPAFIQALTLRWLREEFSADAADHPRDWAEARAAAAMLEWARELPDDDAMKEYIDFFFEAVASYSLMREAQRRNDMEGFLAARRTLLPLHAVSGSRNYVPHLIRDISNIKHVWTEDIRAWRKRNFTIAGTPADFVVEQEIKREKSTVSGTRFLDFEVAAMFTAYAEDFRKVLEREQGLKLNDSVHSYPDFAGDRVAARQYFIGRFQVSGLQAGHGLTEISDWPNQEAAVVRPEAQRYRGLMDEGARRIKDYAPALLKAKDKVDRPTLPQALVPKPVYTDDD